MNIVTTSDVMYKIVECVEGEWGGVEKACSLSNLVFRCRHIACDAVATVAGVPLVDREVVPSRHDAKARRAELVLSDVLSIECSLNRRLCEVPSAPCGCKYEGWCEHPVTR